MRKKHKAHVKGGNAGGGGDSAAADSVISQK